MNNLDSKMDTQTLISYMKTMIHTELRIRDMIAFMISADKLKAAIERNEAPDRVPPPTYPPRPEEPARWHWYDWILLVFGSMISVAILGAFVYDIVMGNSIFAQLRYIGFGKTLILLGLLFFAPCQYFRLFKWRKEYPEWKKKCKEIEDAVEIEREKWERADKLTKKNRIGRISALEEECDKRIHLMDQYLSEMQNMNIIPSPYCQGATLTFLVDILESRRARTISEAIDIFTAEYPDAPFSPSDLRSIPPITNFKETVYYEVLIADAGKCTADLLRMEVLDALDEIQEKEVSVTRNDLAICRSMFAPAE